jgi:hypothetical protein
MKGIHPDLISDQSGFLAPLSFLAILLHQTFAKMMLDQKSQGPCKVQVQVNNALRLALGVNKMDHISVEEILDRKNSLSYNQLVIQATQRLTNSIIKGDCKGLKGFFEFECDLESKRTTRSTVKGELPSQGFRHQSVKLWNSWSQNVDMRKAKLIKMQLRTFPK